MYGVRIDRTLLGALGLCAFTLSLVNGFTNSIDNRFQSGGTRVVSLHVESHIRYRFSTVTVVSTVVNDRLVAQEISYDVTLPEAAFISEFNLDIDGKVYSGVVKEKNEAKKNYEHAKSRGQSAGHIYTRQRNTNRFRVAIFVAPLSEVTFTLTYNELLQRRRGSYEHTIYINPGVIVDNLLVEVTIQEYRKLTHLHVPPLQQNAMSHHHNNIWNSYVVMQRPSPSSAYIRYNPSPEDQKRASLQGMSGLFIVEYDIERNKDAGEVLIVNGYFVHYFSPIGLRRMPREIVFILDSSGSMAGKKIKQLKTALKEILKNLDKRDRFNILQFSGSISRWWKADPLTSVSQKTLASATAFIDGIQADGWTNINSALLEGLQLYKQDNSSGFSPLIIFLTDGEPTEGETDPVKILQNIQVDNAMEIPIFSLAFGQDADYSFLRKMSAKNNGFVRKIYEASDAALQLTGFYKEVSSTLMSNLTFRYLDDHVIRHTMTNAIHPSYFEGSELVISGQLTNDSINSIDIAVSGLSSEGPLELTSRTNVVQQFDTPSVASNFSDITEKIWAYMSIKHLLIERLKQYNQTARDLIKSRVTELALKYNFVTPLTSMVVTLPDKQDVVDSTGDYEVNDSPHSVWDNALTASTGQALAGSSPSFVDSDPHFIIRVKGLTTSVCFDVMGKDGDILNLVRDEISGIVVDATVAASVRQNDKQRKNQTDDSSKKTSDSKVKTFLGKITISGSRTRIQITPQKWTVNGKANKWRASQATSIHKTKLVTDGTGKMLAIMFPHRITLLVVRHMRNKAQIQMGKIHFLGFYIVDDRGFSWHTHGLLGQFIYRHITLTKTWKVQKGKRTRGKLKVDGNTRKVYKVVATLGRRLNLATNAYVQCWMVQKNGRRLLDGTYTDYIVTNHTASYYPKKPVSRRHSLH